MAAIVPKLNLNKTPNIPPTNSLIFAKNIRLDIDGSIHKDYGIKSLITKNAWPVYSRFNNLGERVLHDVNAVRTTLEYYQHYYEVLTKICNPISGKATKFNIVGIIPDSNDFYILCHCREQVIITQVVTHYSFIIKYSEKDDTFLPCNCNWVYSGGTIDGYVVKNLVGETIINIGETTGTDQTIPFKSINLSKSSYTDDETLYTQTPNIPITNLEYGGEFDYVIPNGVYQFFIRYKIREEFYTDWFPASREFFAGNQNGVVTNFGSLRYVNTHTDSDSSFIFLVKHLYDTFNSNYESFQIGFILSHDNTIVGRGWKHFSFKETSVNFDYKAEDAEEIEVSEFLKPTYQLYNVGNITSFKNKLYVSNYKETNFNEDLSAFARKVSITLTQTSSQDNETYYGAPIQFTQNGSKKYVVSLDTNAPSTPATYTTFDGEDNIIHSLLQEASSSNSDAITLLENSIKADDSDNDAGGYSAVNHLYGFEILVHRDKFSEARGNIETEVSNYDNYVSGPTFFDNSVKAFVLNKTTRYDVGNSTAQAVLETVKAAIYNSIKYLSYEGVLLDASFKPLNTFEIQIIRQCTYSKNTVKPKQNIDETVFTNGLTPGGETLPVTVRKEYPQIVTITINADASKFSYTNAYSLRKYTTLIPFQKYKFYIHFIKQTGEVTNGYYCNGDGGGEKEAPYIATPASLIYPTFSIANDAVFPEGYVGYFFSIFHSSVLTSTVFDVKLIKDGSDNDVSIEGQCIEANTRLIPVTNKIICKDNSYSYNGDYHYSSDLSSPRYFGCAGLVEFNKSYKNTIIDNNNPNKVLYAVTDYSAQEDIDINLTKCTPFINSSIKQYSKYDDLNLLGYLCEVLALDNERTTKYYTDGSTVYKKQNNFNITSISGNVNLSLEDLTQYNDTGVPKIADFGLYPTTVKNIYSNYNLNYLALSEDPKQVITSYYPTRPSSATESTEKAVKVIWRLYSSLTLADVYTLPAMYKLVTRKQYDVYSPHTQYQFDNTIRSSVLNGDESKVSIFKFEPEDYYNVPTNRGIIVNLESIGDIILVHTQDSMFRFTGSNTLSGSGGDVATKESEVFDTGIAEVFGSDFGFAGLQDKSQAIITQYGYIFYDGDSKSIYTYSGQGQIVKISDSIEKLFQYSTITNVVFANDFYNNRFFVCIFYLDNNSVTLSFNTLEHSKAFVSLHDFKFKTAFNTKTNCYFINDNEDNIATIDKTFNAVYELLYKTSDTLYPIDFQTITKTYGETIVQLKNYSAIVDIVVNDNYEVVKTLNAVEWCSAIINKVFKTISSDILSARMAEPSKQVFPCHQLLIYTDTCKTDLIDCTITANSLPITNTNSYKYPRYNQGKWNLNYFRNILSTSDEFEYLDNYDDGRAGAHFRSDNNSLIEGKYFVIRFIFKDDKDFKLETLTANVTNKL